jgi:large subunit ribosomal protein L33
MALETGARVSDLLSLDYGDVSIEHKDVEYLNKKSKKKQTKVYLIPESESRDSHTYHYLAIKTKKLVIENQKLRLKKFNPAKQIHEWFIEAKLPPHSK